MLGVSAEVLGLILGVVFLPIIVALVFAVAALSEAWEQRQRCRSAYAHAQEQTVAAQLAIREIRRQAVCDLIAAEREYRWSGQGDVIEGTAVEVGR